jgi:putative oxidoreductase
MKTIFKTDANNWTALVARLALGLVVFPHGAQKLLGWFGGYGFEGTMGFLTGAVGLPWFGGLLVILIEFFGALMLIFGAGTRIAALGTLGVFIGVVLTSHINNGFFMNWSATAGQGEGLEYFFLLFGLAIVSLIAGGGKYSVDAALTSKPIETQDISFTSKMARA